AMAGFDRARPLWEYTLVEGLPDGAAAMILKVHHSMTDGVGGMKLLLMLFDFEPEPPPAVPLDRVDAVPVYGAFDLLWESAGHACRRRFGIARRRLGSASGVARHLATAPGAPLESAARSLDSLARYLAPATEPRSSLLRARTLARSLATLDDDFDDLRR